jgi:hypothetical protein
MIAITASATSNPVERNGSGSQASANKRLRALNLDQWSTQSCSVHDRRLRRRSVEGLKRPPDRADPDAIFLSQFRDCRPVPVTVGDNPLLAASSRSGRPNFLPCFLARSTPSSVCLRIRPRSNSAMPPMMVSISLPASVVVLHQLSPRVAGL